MYAAYGKQGELVYAEYVARESAEGSNVFSCPKCHQPVYLKCSRRGKYYFAHRRACQSLPVHRAYAETEKHKRAKALLLSACQQCNVSVECEYYWADIQQTADIYLPSERLVIEFQHSPISSVDLQSRTNCYRQLGLTVIWLMDIDSFHTRYGIGWHQTMLQVNAYHELYWQMLDVKKGDIIEWRQMAIFYRKNYRAHLVERMSLRDWIRNGFQFARQSYKLEVKRPRNIHYQRQLIQLRHSPSYQQALQALYQAGTVLQEIPAWIICEQWHCLLTKTPGWLVLAWVHTLVPQVSTFQQLNERLTHILEWVALPWLNEEAKAWVAHSALRLYAKQSPCPIACKCDTLIKPMNKGV